MPSPTQKVLTAIQNIPKRRKSISFRAQSRPSGKENAPPPSARALKTKSYTYTPPLPRPVLPAVDSDESFIQMPSSDRWSPQDGHIIIKVWVPSTDDIWNMKVAEDISLDAFLRCVALKVGFPVTFSTAIAGQMRPIETDDEFKTWVAGRVRYGRNHLLTVHRVD